MSSVIANMTLVGSPIANRDAILSTMADEVATSTQKAYAQAIRSMRKFYAEKEWEFYPNTGDHSKDASLFVERVLSYLRSIADAGRTFSTVNKTLAAIKNIASFENPPMYSALHARPVKSFMEGLARQTRSHEAKQAQAFTIDELSTLYKTLNGHTPRDIRDKALVSLGIATALRSQSIADLTLSDITPAISIDGVNVRVRFSKTDQTGQGTYIPVARAKKKRLDPVAAINAWIAVLKAFGYTKDTHPDFPLFPTIRGQRGIQAGPMLHSSVAITDMVRARIVDAGVVGVEQAVAYSSHSLRATFITLSNQAGVPEKDIALVSGHKDMNTLRSYDRTTAEKSAQSDYLNVR
jgi:integrase